MDQRTLPHDHPSSGGRYQRDTLEFARLVNLSDAVFAIAMTLLVLGLTVPNVQSARLAAELVGVVPQLLAFVLGFALVGSVWWQHHKFVARLAHADRGLVVLTLALLGAVAVVPFPTGLVGSYPTSRAAVLPFIGVFVLLLTLFVASVRHAQRTGAWQRAMPERTYRWVVAGFVVTIVALLVAALVALLWPLAALGILALSNLPEALLARRAPPDYRDWS